MTVLILFERNGKRTEIQTGDIMVYDDRINCKGIRILRKGELGEEYSLPIICFPGSDKSEIYPIKISENKSALLGNIAVFMTLGNQKLWYKPIKHPQFGDAIKFYIQK